MQQEGGGRRRRDKTDENGTEKKGKGERGLSKKNEPREPAGPPGKRTQTHTPDPRFTLNTHTVKTAGLSLHLQLNFSLRLTPPLSPHHDLLCAIAPVSSHTHRLLLPLILLGGRAEKQSDVLPSHFLFVFSHFSSVNGVLYLPSLPRPPPLFVSTLHHFFCSFLSSLAHF